jgi:hypothetical protein
MSPAEQVELDKWLEENLAKGYLRPSKSPMASPVATHYFNAVMSPMGHLGTARRQQIGCGIPRRSRRQRTTSSTNKEQSKAMLSCTMSKGYASGDVTSGQSEGQSVLLL